jgi:hypothetical protein
MLWWVSSVSLGMSIVSFLLFVIFMVFPKSTPAPFGAGQQQAELEGLAKAVEALSKLVDSFSKAGPAALTLSGSMVFMVISLVAAIKG